MRYKVRLSVCVIQSEAIIAVSTSDGVYLRELALLRRDTAILLEKPAAIGTLDFLNDLILELDKFLQFLILCLLLHRSAHLLFQKIGIQTTDPHCGEGSEEAAGFLYPGLREGVSRSAMKLQLRF